MLCFHCCSLIIHLLFQLEPNMKIIDIYISNQHRRLDVKLPNTNVKCS